MLLWRLLKIKNQGFFAWHLYAWGMPWGPRKTLRKPFLASPSPWGSAQTPSKSKESPLTKVKIENHQIVLFDSSNEASWWTDCNAKKTRPFFQCTVLEIMRLDRQKGRTKFGPFYSFFLIFSKMVPKTVSSSLHSVDQDTSYQPSNTLWTWTALKKFRKNYD